MIDTVVLLIPVNKIVSKSNLIRDATQKEELSIALGKLKHLKNNTGLYIPKVSIVPKNKHSEPCIRIEFSVQKLLDKSLVTESDFEKTISLLVERLQVIGVRVTGENLISGKVTSIHYSKDILLKKGYTSSYIISELSKISTRKNIDLSSTTYNNNGKSISIRTSMYQFIFYDKKSEQSLDTKQEILRLEVRLTKAKKVTEMQTMFSPTRERTFKNLFSEMISKGTIRYYWDKYIKTNDNLFLSEQTPIDTLKNLLLNKPDQSIRNILYDFALLELSKSKLNELRTLFDKHVSASSWYRLVSKLKKVQQQVNPLYVRDWVNYLENELIN